MQKILIGVGLVILIIGITWPWFSSIPFGRLPGDIVIEREHSTFYFPIVTMIIVSAVISLILWLFRH
jgi:hypothetical protein